jgi:hypothetical protein
LGGLLAYENKFTELPPEFGNLHNLGDANLSDSELTTLPDEFAQLQNLEKLQIYGNKIPKEVQEKFTKLLPNCDISWGATIVSIEELFGNA